MFLQCLSEIHFNHTTITTTTTVAATITYCYLHFLDILGGIAKALLVVADMEENWIIIYSIFCQITDLQ